MKARPLGAILTVAAMGCTALAPSVLASAAPPVVSADPAPLSLDEARRQLDAAQTTLKNAQTAQREAQQGAEQASQAAADAATAADQAAARAERSRTEQSVAAEGVVDARANLGRLAAHAYANNSGFGQIAELATTSTPEDFYARSANLSQLMRVQETMAYDAEAARADAANAADRAKGQSDAAAAASAEADALVAAAEEALASAATATEDAEAAIAEVQRVYAEAKRAADEADGTSRSDRDEDTGDDTGGDPPVTGSGTFIKPSSGPITSPYGMRVHPVTGVYKLHSGTDFGASCGSRVIAADAGTVEETGYAGAYGNRVTVSHGNIGGVEVTTTYNHLSSTSVSAGQSVGQGDAIGAVGTTGSSTGCHLHWEVLVNGEFSNPMGWL